MSIERLEEPAEPTMKKFFAFEEFASHLEVLSKDTDLSLPEDVISNMLDDFAYYLPIENSEKT